MPVPDMEDVPVTGPAAPLSPIEKVEQRLEAIETIEHERTGAGKLTNRLLLLFGGLGTAAVIAFATVTWNGHAAAVTRGAAISRLDEKLGDHGHPVLETQQQNHAERLIAVETGQVNITKQLDRQTGQLDELLLRIPVRRRR